MAQQSTHSTTAQQLIEQFKIEPTISIDASINESDTTQSETQSIIPTSHSNAVQFTQRPMYSSSYNPMHQRRNKAIQAIYQFLAEENLTETLHQLQQETRITYDHESLTQFGVLLEAIDLRTAYYSAQHKSINNTHKYLEMLETKQKLDEKPCINLLYSFNGVHKSNILCIDIFYYNDTTYIISGVASRCLMILSCKDIFTLTPQKPNEYNYENDSISRIVSQMGVCAPPLYIDIDRKYNRYAVITCMDGSSYVIDLYSCITSRNDWKYTLLKHHTKYVTMARWSPSSEYILTAAHDNKSTLYTFNTMGNDEDMKESVFIVNKMHQYEFEGCVEAIAWISEIEFVIMVRNSTFLEYYKLENDDSYLQPYLRCNVNAFGDNHVSFCIGDIHVSKDGEFILAKTDHEKVLLMINKSEDVLKTYFGSHSDLYTYTRCCFSKEEKYIYASHHNDFVIWDIFSAKLIYRQANAHKQTLRDMCLDKKNGVIVTASFDKTIKIWSS